MSQPFTGEIRIWGCNFAPQGWAFCSGQVMPISQNAALFSLLGTNFGGNGTTTYCLPNLGATIPMAWGTSTTGATYEIGNTGGASIVRLTEAQVPPHSHALQANPRLADLADPSPDNSLARATPLIYKQPSGAATPNALAQGAVGSAGGGQPHNNMMPVLTLNFCIALSGIFPERQ
jgi:microcystin-dependent protein